MSAPRIESNLHDLFEILKNRPIVSLSSQIEDNLNRIISICNSHYSNRIFYGHAALNRRILLDSRIAECLTPDVIGYLFTNPDDETKITRSGESILLRDCIQYGINEGLYVIKFMPNNESVYNKELYETQKINFENVTLKILDNIKKSANFQGKSTAEVSFEDIAEIPLNQQLDQIIKAIDIIYHQGQEKKLLNVNGHSPISMQKQMLQGLYIAATSLNIEMKEFFGNYQINEELTAFCIRFLSNPDVLLNPVVSHQFYDRSHFLVALTLSVQLFMQDQKYFFRDLMRKLVITLDESSADFPESAKEQFAVRLFLIRQDLQSRFSDAWKLMLESDLTLINSSVEAKSDNESVGFSKSSQFWAAPKKFSSPYIFNFNFKEAEDYLVKLNDNHAWLVRNSGTQLGLISVSVLLVDSISGAKQVVHSRFGLTEDGWAPVKNETLELANFIKETNRLSQDEAFVNSHNQQLLSILCETTSFLDANKKLHIYAKSLDKLQMPSVKQTTTLSMYNRYAVNEKNNSVESSLLMKNSCC